MSSARPRPLVAPVFLPQAGCPHACAFCNQAAITGRSVRHPTARDVRREIEKFLDFGSRRDGPVQIAFYGGNFLGQDADRIVALLRVAAEFVAAGRAEGIRFSTRPDTVDPQSLDRIAPFPVTVIELGVQSMNNEVLRLNRRGHDAESVQCAATALRRRGYRLGLQMMVGLAGEDPEATLASGRALAALAPDFVRIYPTLVLRGSMLARWYRQGSYRPLPLEEAVGMVKGLYLLFHRRGIRVVRMGLQSSPSLDAGGDLLAGPYHPAFGHLVHSRIFGDALLRGLAAARRNTTGAVEVRVHPASTARLRGMRNDNVRRAEKRYGPDTLRIMADASVDRRELVVGGSVLHPYEDSASDGTLEGRSGFSDPKHRPATGNPPSADA